MASVTQLKFMSPASSLTADAFQAGNRRTMEVQSPLWLSQGVPIWPLPEGGPWTIS